MLVASVALGGALGAALRYVVDGLVQSRARGVFPYGTFVINVTGSFVLGLVTGLALYHGLGPLPRALIGTGLCGAYTTFATFSYESVRLLEEGSFAAAMSNVFLSLIAGLLAAAAGIAVVWAW